MVEEQQVEKGDLLSRLKGRLTGRPKYAPETTDCGKGLCTVLIRNYFPLCMLNHKIIAREHLTDEALR